MNEEVSVQRAQVGVGGGVGEGVARVPWSPKRMCEMPKKGEEPSIKQKPKKKPRQLCIATMQKNNARKSAQN